MSQSVAVRELAESPSVTAIDAGQVMFEVLAKGDLNALSPEEIARYEVAVCRSVGLNPLTKPFDVITLPGKKDEPPRKIMYANRNAGDQLSKIYKISREIVSREVVDNVYIVTARVTTPDGRSDESIGAVSLVREGGSWKARNDGKGSVFEPDGTFVPLSPEQRANKIMHAETKAKRRAVLSLVGLSFLDESELDTMALPTAGTSVRAINAERNLDKLAEAKALGSAIVATFAVDATEAKRIRGDLLCDRFDLTNHNDATAEQIYETRLAVESWEQPWADENLKWLRMVASAETATMARDVETVLGQHNVNDPFVLGALIDRLDALELEERRTQTRIAKAIDAVATPS